MSRVYQIHEEDLAELERIVPQLGEALSTSLTPLLKTQLRRCKLILSNLRWNYGPPECAERIPADDHDS